MKTCPDGTHCQNEYLIEELEHQLDLCEHVAKTMTELHDQRVGEIYELAAELATLREQVRWIPVSERLPDFLTPTLTVYRTKTGISAITLRYRLDEYFWIDEEGNKVPKKNVTHWMPLPKPPEGE